MNPSLRWRTPLLGNLLKWLDKELPGPDADELRQGNADWDYAQTNSDALWDREIDPERLSAALRDRREDPAGAFEELLDLALTGSVIAMSAVGECYYWGVGAAKDQARGESWFKKAFAAGSPRGLLNYGKVLFWRGDLGGAIAVFRRGVDQELAPSLYWLAIALLRLSNDAHSRREARTLLEQAAAKGSPAARWRLGRDMARGRYGLREIPRGLRLIVAFATETLEVREAAQKAHARQRATGETVH